MFDKIDAFLTPDRRARLYSLAVAVGAILVAKGVVDADSLGDYLVVVALVLGTAAPAVAKRNVRR